MPCLTHVSELIEECTCIGVEAWQSHICDYIKCKHCMNGTPTKRQASKRQVSKRLLSKLPVSKRQVTKRQVCKTSGFKTSGFKTFGFKTSVEIKVSICPVFKFDILIKQKV
jgi:hypothetical protein